MVPPETHRRRVRLWVAPPLRQQRVGKVFRLNKTTPGSMLAYLPGRGAGDERALARGNCSGLVRGGNRPCDLARPPAGPIPPRARGKKKQGGGGGKFFLFCWWGHPSLGPGAPTGWHNPRKSAKKPSPARCGGSPRPSFLS